MTRVQPNIKRHGTLVKKNPRDPDEVWKPTTISNKYDVSSYGRVRNAKRGNVLRQTTKPLGYKTVFFLKKTYYVHQLMLLSFVGEPKEDQTVDHIDRKPYNNHISNLRWASKKEQISNSVRAEKHQGRRIMCTEVDTGEETEFISIAHAAKSVAPLSSFAYNTIRQRITKFMGEDKEFIGRRWSFIEPEPVGEIKPVPSAPGYNVSSCGMVQGLYKRWTRGFKIGGYMAVSIMYKQRLVHRLIAEAFLDTPRVDETIVNHKDGIKTNNCLENLEYVTPSENIQHAYDIGLMETTKVLQICKDTGKILQEHDSVKDALKFLGEPRSSHIGECCLGRSATAYGYRWAYPGESEKYAHLVKPPKKIVRMSQKNGEVLQVHASITEAYVFVGSSDFGSSITACCMRKRVSSHGYRWSYEGEESTHVYKKKGKAVLRLCNETGNVIQRYDTQTEAGILFSPAGNSSSITLCCRGKRPTAHGYKWRFE